MMAMKGYLRAPRLHGRKQQQAAQREPAYGGESLMSAALLDAGDLAAAAVPKGYFAVYVGVRDLMERAAVEFGFAQAGGIGIPCREEDFEATVTALETAVVARRRRRPDGVGKARSL